MDAPEYGMGRRYVEDTGDYNFLIHNRLAEAVDPNAVRLQRKLWPIFDRPLNQGRTGTCVGHAWKHYMLTAPTIQTMANAEPTAIQIYLEALPHDPWDNEGDLMFGTSVRAGAKALRARGIIDTFTWAFNVDDALRWLCGVDPRTGRFVGGPLVIGVNWYTSMLAVDAEGFVRVNPTDRVEGGHAVMLIGANVAKGYAVGLNSWGWEAWGYPLRAGTRRTGRFKIDFDVLDRLIRENGEVCAAQEIRLPRVPIVT